MKTRVAVITTALTLGIGGFFFAHAASNTTLTLEERVSTLEARLQKLEAKMGSAASEVVAPAPREVKETAEPKKLNPPPPEVGGTVKSQNVASWNEKLSRGMTKEEVTALLGKPDTLVNYARAGERWWYVSQSGGTIDFSFEGRVESWLQPQIK